MLLVYGIVAAILIGYLMGGRARNYLAQPLRGVLLPALALAIEACFGLLAKRWEPALWLGWATCAEYALLAAFVALNFRRRGTKLLALATALNFAVIACNGFSMPFGGLASAGDLLMAAGMFLLIFDLLRQKPPAQNGPPL